MILDYQNLFSNDQAITGSDVESTNIIDLGADGSEVPSPNEKGQIEILCQVTETFADGESLSVELEQDTAEAFSSPADLVVTPAIAVASLIAGYQFIVAVPAEKITERYIRLYYNVTGTMTAGKITAGLVLNRQTNG